MFLTAHFATDLLAARLRAVGYDLSSLSASARAEVDSLARAARSLANETGIDHKTVSKAMKGKAKEGSAPVGGSKNSNDLNGGGEFPHPAEDGRTSPGPVSRVDARRR